MARGPLGKTSSGSGNRCRDGGGRPMNGASYKGKPVARRGRKARGLSETAQPPTHHWTSRVSAGQTRRSWHLPYVNRPKHPRGRMATLLGMSVIALFCAPAAAHAACPTAPTTKAFQAFGDTADYSLLANGGFEAGTGGWSLTGAWVAAGNESYKVRAATDSKSLAITPGG